MMDKRYGRVEWGIHGTRVRTSDANWSKPRAWDRQPWCECPCGWRGELKAAGVGDDGRLICPVCTHEVMSARRRVFCASLADVFEGPESMPAAEWNKLTHIKHELFELIGSTPNLDWMLLTKRPENVMDQIDKLSYWSRIPDNVWIGTSVEDQEQADKRIPELCKIPAKVRFLSCEPLLGPVDLALDGTLPIPEYTAGYLKIDWVIGGGESGPNARPCNVEWAESLLSQCLKFKIPFHWKQWGEWKPIQGVFEDGWLDKAHAAHVWDKRQVSIKLGKHAAGRTLDGKIWDQFPEVQR
jgi:protein gp37